MRIGIMTGTGSGSDGSLDGVIQQVRDIETRGFESVWMANIFGLDAISTLAMAARETDRIELGTAVVPSYPRHPSAMAQQCLTAQAAAKGRFVLGVGLSHRLVIEDLLGMSYAKPARHMREYLSVLEPLLSGDPVHFKGEEYRVNLTLDFEGVPRVPILVAALGERMLDLAGRMSDGTILWMTGPRTIETHIAPRLRAAAKDAGRPEPRIVASIPMLLTREPDVARERIAKTLKLYGTLPSYRAMLDREGIDGPGDLAFVGDESELDAGLDRMRDLGISDFNASIVPVEDGGYERTIDYLQSRI